MAKRKLNTRNILKLADLLMADARRKRGIKFDMGDWGSVENLEKPLSCGTTACAMGLAALSGAFKRQGLTAYISGRGSVYPMWKGNLRTSFDWLAIAERLFGIAERTANVLFTPGSLPGLEEGAAAERLKAKQLRELVRLGEEKFNEKY